MKGKERFVRLAAVTSAVSLALAVLLPTTGMAATGRMHPSGRAGFKRAGIVFKKAPFVRHSFFGHRPFARSRFVSPTVGSPIVGTTAELDPGTSAPSIPLVIVQGAPPVVSQEEPTPPPLQPSYSWYYCGPKGTAPQPADRAPAYCLGGVKPSVTVLPGPGKTLDQFQADDLACQQWASTQASTMPGAVSSEGVTSGPIAGSVQERFDIAYQQCMYAKENQLPGVARAAPPGNSAPSIPG